MSTSIDNKVVELKFDNRDFEKNTKQSMATLDKLKTSLDMTDAERNFEKLSRASDKVSFRDASESVDTFSVKLSAMSSVAVAAIGRITNQLIDLGEQFLRNLSGIDYINTGFSKYEDIIGYQQTMLANAKNLSEDQMQKLLDKLVWFSDETSFNADNMMQAMSSYISAGADELTSQAAALGTALWAALTGNSNESLAIANRNLPQIFGKGYMQLQDWQSIVTAKMDAPWIREMFIETAADLKTLEKRADGFYTKIGKNWEKVDASSFTATFKGGWLTTKVLLETFQKLTKFTDDVYDEVNETGELAFDVIRRLGTDLDDVGYKALKNAQETKTWSEAWTYVQGAVTAGWSTTFETIFGSFNTARDFFSNIVESLYTIFVAPGNERNNIFEAWAEYTPYVAKDVKDVADNVEKTVTKLENAREIVLNIIRGNYGNGAVRVKALAEKYGADVGRDLQLTVNEVWKQWDGKTWSLNYERLDELTADGLVTTKTAEALKEAAEEIEESGEEVLNARDDFLDGLTALGEGIAAIFGRTNYWMGKDITKKVLGLDPESLYNFTHKYAEKFRAFRDMVALPDDYDDVIAQIRDGMLVLEDIPEDEDKAIEVGFSAARSAYAEGSPGFKGDFIYPLVQNLKTISDIVKNLLAPIKQVFQALGEGIMKAFFPEGEKTMFDYQVSLGKFLNKIKELTDKFRLTDEQSEKLSRIFQGLLTPLRIVWKVITSIATAVTDVFTKTSYGLGKKTLLDRILDIGDGIANIVIGFDEWLEKTGVIDNFVIPAVEFLSDAFGRLWDWIKKLLGVDSNMVFPSFDDVLGAWKNAKTWIHEHIISPIENFLGIDLHIPTIDELLSAWKSIKSWVSDHIVIPVKEAFESLTGIELKWPTWEGIKTAWSGFKDWLNKHIVEPFKNAFSNLTGKDFKFSDIFDNVKSFFSKIWEFIKDLFSDKASSGVSQSQIQANAKEKEGIIQTIGTIIVSLLEIIKHVITYVAAMFKELAKDETFRKLLGPAVLGGLLTLLPHLYDSLWVFFMRTNWRMALAEIGTAASDFMYASANKKNTEAIKNMAQSLLMIVGAMILLTAIPIDDLKAASAVIIELFTVLIGLFVFIKTSTSRMSAVSANLQTSLSNSLGSGLEFSRMGSMIMKIGLGILLMAVAIRIVSKIADPKQLRQGLMAIEELLAIIWLMIYTLQKSASVIDKNQKIGLATAPFLSMAVLIFVLASAIKKLSKIPNFGPDHPAFTAVRDLLFLIGAIVVMTATVTKDSTGKGAKLGGALLGVTALIITIVAVIGILTKSLKPEEMETFYTVSGVIAGFLVLIGGLIVALAYYAKKSENKVKDPTKFLKSAAALALIMTSLSALFATIVALVIVLAHTVKNSSDNDFKTIMGALGGVVAIAVVLAIAAGALYALSNKYEYTTIKPILGMSVLILALSAALTMIVLAVSVLVNSISKFGNANNLVGATIAVLAIIGTLLGGIVAITVLFKSTASTKIGETMYLDAPAIFKAWMGLTIVIVALGAVVTAIILALSTLVKATTNWKVAIAAGAAVTGIVTVLLAGLALVILTVNKMEANVGEDAIFKMLSLTVLIGALGVFAVAVSGSLAILVSSLSNTENTTKVLSNAVKAISATILALVLLVAALSKIDTADPSSLEKYVIAFMGLSVGLVAIAISLGALTAVVGNKNISGDGGIGALWACVGAITALLAVLGGLAILASVPMFTAGFTVLTAMLAAIGASATGFGLAVALIVSALVLLKDQVYDIGQNASKFEAGVDVIFTSFTESFRKNFPAVLATITDSGHEIAKAILTMLVDLAVSIKERIPDLVAQAMESAMTVLSSLEEYIGPLVAVIFDFLVELLEGVAYALNTRGGKIVAAIMDVIASLIVLTNTVISGLLSFVLRALGLDVIADGVVWLFGNISKETVTAMASAGEDVIKQSEDIGNDIVKNSPRLAEYYEKYGKTIENAISSGTDGITTTLTGSGNSISGAMEGAFSLDGMSSLFNLGSFGSLGDSLGLGDFGDLTGFGVSAGDSYSKGVEKTLVSFSVSDLFPSTQEYYDAGMAAAKANTDGWTKVLIDNIRSGKLTSLEQIKNWAEQAGASSDFINEMMDKYEAGEISTVKEIADAYEAKIDSEAKTTAQHDAQKDFAEMYASENVDAVKQAFALQGDYMRETGGGRYSMDKMVASVVSLASNLTDRTLLNDTEGLVDYLRTVYNLLGEFEDIPEYSEARNLIDYILGVSDSSYDPGEAISTLTAYGDARTKIIEEYFAKREEEEARLEAQRKIEERHRKDEAARAKKDAEDEKKRREEAAAAMIPQYKSVKRGISSEAGESYYLDLFDQFGPSIQQLIIDMVDGYKAEKDYISNLTDKAKEVYYWLKEHKLDYTIIDENANPHVWWLDTFGGNTPAYKELLVYGYSKYFDYMYSLYQDVPQFFHDELAKFGTLLLEKFPDIDFTKVLSEDDFISVMQFMMAQGIDIGEYFVEGIIVGLDLKNKRNTPAKEGIIRAVNSVSDAVIVGTQQRMEIESPSKVAERIGRYFVEGLANGISETSDDAEQASEDAAASTINSLKQALLYAANMNLDDLNPVIRPILDLSDIVNGSDQINALLASGQVYRRGTGLGIGAVGYTDLNAIAQMNKISLAQAIQESVLSQPVNQEINNTFNIQSNDPDVVARKVSAILSNQIQRKNQVWGPLKNYNVAQ